MNWERKIGFFRNRDSLTSVAGKAKLPGSRASYYVFLVPPFAVLD